jgi:UDP-perosamine 4-acetyltransferase
MGNYEILGCLGLPGETGNVLGVEIIGSDQDLDEYKNREDLELFIAIGDNQKRRDFAEQLGNQGFRFATLISPNTYIAKDTSIGVGSLVMHGVVINPSVSIGRQVIINTRASIDHDCKVEDFVHIAPGVSMAGNVTVGRSTFVGIGSSIIPKIVIGKDVTIGAGAVVIRNIEDNMKVAGVPAKPLA